MIENLKKFTKYCKNIKIMLKNNSNNTYSRL